MIISSFCHLYSDAKMEKTKYTVSGMKKNAAELIFVINFDDPRKSHRCNSINPIFMKDISDAYESAYTIMLNLNRSWIQKQGNFFVESPIILLAAIFGFSKSTRMASIAPFHTPLNSSIVPMRKSSSSSLPMMNWRTTFPPLWILGRVVRKISCRDR